MKKAKYTREQIIRILKQLDAEGKQPGTKALAEKGVSPYWVRELIPEGLTELKRKLGLKISAQEQPRTDDELFRKIDETVLKLECIPSFMQLKRETGITGKTFTNRFGNKGIREVFNRYREWLKKAQPASKNIELVDAYFEAQDKTKSPTSQPAGIKNGARGTKWPKGTGREYGAPLNFGSLIYEPTNEDGVIFLFGIVSKALGFSIEYIGPDFPDCEAKRYIVAGC